ncbi:hypothetical protein SASPL_114343 [Salvia splendens]|uniref:Uncharacterized protein n=1 Tax=Salvia splendens TaxID=180675 RepID=A0A8X8Y5F2_SALSN|nr:hypothetical protein SASPL_114343 [Salvia splendens]
MGFEEKMVDEEFCYEIELIPGCHSSSLDQESDAHQEKNDSSNWMGSFLEEADDSKSSLVDDNNHDKATFDDDEFTKMECHSVKMSDDSDLLWDVVGVTDSSSSCVDNCSQQKCLDSDDDYEDDRVDGDERRSYNLTAAEFQLVRVLVQRFMEDKQFGGRRNDAGVRSRCMIRSLLQAPAIEDDFVKTKAREERDGVEMLVGVISEMMQRSPRPSTQPWRPEIMGFEEKMVDEEFCYEIELIPGCHSSSLDQESDAHQEKNDSSNWMGSFLEEADDSKSSLVDDNNHDKATFDDDEFTKMECHSVKMSDDSDLLWDVVGVTDSSSSCVDNCSQHKCLDSDDDYEDDRVDGDERHSYNLTAAEFQMVRVLVQRFMEDKQFGGRRNDAGVRSRCMIRSLLQVPAIEDDFVKTKAREERDGVEMLVGVISEMMQRSPRPSTQPWRPEIMGFEEKMVDEEFCYEIELIPGCHSSSLDQESDAHQEKNDSSNWMGSFLEEADDSKSSLVDDNNHDKATFDDDEFTKMECHSVKMSDDSDLLWDVVGVTDSSSSCVDNCSQHKCLDSDDDYEDDRVDGDERHSYNLTAAEFQMVRVLVQRFMEDKQFGGRRNDAGVRSRCMIRSLLQVPAIEDDFVKTKAREERDGVEMLVGVISEMMWEPSNRNLTYKFAGDFPDTAKVPAEVAFKKWASVTKFTF